MAREIACGWPCRALYALRIHLSDGVNTEVRGGIEFNWGTTSITLCMLPIPLGFIANTLIFAAAFAVPLLAFPALRRHFRVQRSRCPSCNYDLRGLPSPTCPECGRISS